MRIEEIKIYQFSELSEEAKERAIEWYRSEEDFSFIYQGSGKTLDEFSKMVHPIYDYSYGAEIYRSYIRFDTINGEVENLSGFRLVSWIEEKIVPYITKGKYYSTPGKYINGKYHYKKRRSKIQRSFDCPLTGVCYDMSILRPILEFILPDKELKKYYTGRNYYKYGEANTYWEDILKSCEDEFIADIIIECEYVLSDEYIIEVIEANEYEFTENGNKY